MKTLIEIQNEVAKEFGFYNGYENFVSNMGVTGHELIVKYFNEVCRRAQLECARETLKEASEKGKIQREFMVNHYTKQKETHSESFWSTTDKFYQIDKSSITKASNIKLVE